MKPYVYRTIDEVPFKVIFYFNTKFDPDTCNWKIS